MKSLKIKTGVVKRTGKEKVSYRKEADMQRDKIDKMKAEGKDEADVKKMNEVSANKKDLIPAILNHDSCGLIDILSANFPMIDFYLITATATPLVSLHQGFHLFLCSACRRA